MDRRDPTDSERRDAEPDDQLMTAVAGGDQRALAELIRRHGGRLRAVAARFLGDRAEAEDVTQETFVRAWRNAGRYDLNRAAVGAWLYRIAVNLCLDRSRRRAIRRMVGLEGLAQEPADDAPGVERTIADRDRLARVRREIERLPSRQRMALLLSAVGGLGTRDIAESLGASRGSVEQLLVRARRRLREALADLEGEGAGAAFDGTEREE